MKKYGYGTITVTSDGQNMEQESNADKAIVIIPGVMGSRLFKSDHTFDDTTRIWEPVMPTGFDWNDIIQSDFIKAIADLGNQFESGNLYARKIENQNVSIDKLRYGREYGALKTYEALVDTLCTRFPNKKIYVFSYDWRQSNEESAMELYRTFIRLGIKKADLVCHSMGGLVASKFYMMYRHHNQIDKIITCATPYEGAPKLLNNLINMDVLGEGIIDGDDWKKDITDIILGTLGGMKRELKTSFQGVAELSPTKNYVSKVPMQETIYKYNVKTHRNEAFGRNLSYEEYIKKCEGIFDNKKERKYMYNKIQEFQKSLLTEKGCNALLEYTDAYFAVGIDHKTITSIRFQPDSSSMDIRLYESDLNYKQLGDGTVSFLSATMMGKMLDIAKVKKRSWFFVEDHLSIISSRFVIDWIGDILENGYSGVDSAKLS